MEPGFLDRVASVVRGFREAVGTSRCLKAIVDPPTAEATRGERDNKDREVEAEPAPWTMAQSKVNALL